MNSVLVLRLKSRVGLDYLCLLSSENLSPRQTAHKHLSSVRHLQAGQIRAESSRFYGAALKQCSNMHTILEGFFHFSKKFSYFSVVFGENTEKHMRIRLNLHCFCSIFLLCILMRYRGTDSKISSQKYYEMVSSRWSHSNGKVPKRHIWAITHSMHDSRYNGKDVGIAMRWDKKTPVVSVEEIKKRKQDELNV